MPECGQNNVKGRDISMNRLTKPPRTHVVMRRCYVKLTARSTVCAAGSGRSYLFNV
jgi:hypothetical protein